MWRAVGLCIVSCFAACREQPQPEPAPPRPAPPEAAALPPPTFLYVPPPYGEDVGSLKVLRSIVVRAEPKQDAEPLGTVAQDTRVRWSRAAVGPGCSAFWIELSPRGWVCESYLEANFRPPRAVELPRLLEGDVVPGVYGKIAGGRAFKSVKDARRGVRGKRVADATMVRFARELTVGRRRFWRTREGLVVDARRILPRQPSRFSGVDLGALTGPLLPIAWVGGEAPLTVWEESKRWIELGELPPRALVPVTRTSADGSMVRIAPYEWVEASRLRVARLAPPPAELGPGEKWIDVDLAEQVLVAYEGSRPVFATLVSSGKANPTPTGEWRIWIKFAEHPMRGELNGRSYHVADVPWTMFFFGDFALHAAYWHDHFGERASSGCINLAPRDARFLYHWSTPHVPAGWTMAYATRELPGTRVRIRNGPVGQDVPPPRLSAAGY